MNTPLDITVARLGERMDNIEESHTRSRLFQAEVTRAIEGVKIAFEGVRTKVFIIMWLLGAVATGVIAVAGTLLAGLIQHR
jgi:uncharacterized Zn-binding protein involved in type VI secretion